MQRGVRTGGGGAVRNRDPNGHILIGFVDLTNGAMLPHRSNGFSMPSVLINLDVDDLERAVVFYTQALELRVGRRFDGFVELLGAETPIYLLDKAANTPAFNGAQQLRAYARHWTPLHLDFVVTDLDAAVARALAAGAMLEATPSQHPFGRLALLHDPFGHGFCLMQFQGNGYAEL